MKPIVEIKQLQKTFCKGDICVANHIDLEIYDGEIFTVLGKSGSGKTTFLRMIAGLETPDSGTIIIDNQEVFSSKKNLEPKRRQIAVVFQNYALLPHLNIASNITFGGDFSKEELEEILEKTKLKGQENKMPHELSGGQQQRVALARAIINKPKFLLLDEPLSNIDTELRTHLRAELKQMIHSFGITALFITHDKEDAFYLSDRIAIMHGGDIFQIGTPQEIYYQPKNLYTANFLGKMTQVGENQYIRPELIEIVSHGKFTGKIIQKVFYGNFYEVTLQTDKYEVVCHTLDESLKVGEKVRYQYKGKIIEF